MDSKKIRLELRTVIDRQGEKEMSIVKQLGDYTKKNDVEIITYTEQTEDFGEVKNFISIQPHKMNIKRSGKIKMNQQFVVKKKSAGLYRHPYGSFHLETETKSMQYRPLQKEQTGKVIINYIAKINGTEEQKHHLTLTYTEEKRNEFS